MADFVAVLRKTLDGLESPTPEMREKVYAKARTTISAKLAALNPPPAEAVIERQKQALEQAISEIEAGYSLTEDAPTTDEDPLADFVSGRAFGDPSPADPPKPEPAPAPVAAAQPEASPIVAPEPPPAAAEPFDPPNAADEPPIPPPPSAEAASSRPARRGISGGLIATIVILVLLAGAGYAVWQNKEDFAQLVGLDSLTSDGGQAQTDHESAADAETSSAEPVEPAASAEPAEDANTNTDAAANDADETKFTQRLMEDGTEVDAGPAAEEPSIGEGTSVAAATTDETQPGAPDGEQPADGENVAAADPEATDSDASSTGAEAPEGTALPVGQRAIFYEERTSDLQGSAEPGAVVWSLVEESPGGNLPPEPAIRAEATIPDKQLQFRMTIRRNGDESLPASHIIEMIFITPDDFEGGGIENVLRITFKDSEQSAGNPLLGIPAKISDGFFLLALTDSKADIEANTTMMRRLDWLDIPLVYNSGRRALITMEKGVPGSKVFDEALKAWTPESSG